MLTIKPISFQFRLRKVVQNLSIVLICIAFNQSNAQSVTLAMANPKPNAQTKHLSAQTPAVVTTHPAQKNEFGNKENFAMAGLDFEKAVSPLGSPFLLIHKTFGADDKPRAWLNVNAAFGHPGRNDISFREKFFERKEPNVAYFKASFTF